MENATYESKLYRLTEMSDAISGSIDNAVKVKHEQTVLIDVLKNNNPDKMFDELIKTEEEQVKTLEEQIATLTERQEKLLHVIEACKNDSNVDEIVTTFMLALGMQ